MRVPLRWLREYVDTQDDAASIARALTFAGVGVEAIEGDVLVLEITSNRADLLSILGVARELAVVRGARLKPVRVDLQEGPPIDTPIDVVDPRLCPRYTARLVRGVKVGPAPMWMQQKLQAALGDAYTPVNNIADITNYVMLECGQPLHAFDLRQLRGRKIVVRAARAGEKLLAINGKEYALQTTDLVIADAERPVAIAGVMGGKESEIVASTQDVLIESAMFDLVSVRRTSRRLGLASESSYRFERGVDWEGVEWASRRAAQLMAELGQGTVARGAADVHVAAPKKTLVELRFERVRKLLGMDVSDARIVEIVRGLGATLERTSGGSVVLGAPPGRRDLHQEVDYIEEVARIEGYDKIPTDVQLGLSVAADNHADLAREEIRSVLSALGAFEVLTWSFQEATAAPRSTVWSKEPLLPLRNPRGNVDRTLRSALGPAMEDVLRGNAGCGEPLHPIFEIAHVYYEAPGAPGERAALGIAHPDGVADLRAMVRALFERLQVPLETRASGAQEAILLEGEPIGAMGRLEHFAVAEIDFEKLAGAARRVRKVAAYSPHPSVRRDVAMVFSKEVLWPQIEEAILGLGLPILQRVAYLNHFEGKQLGEGKRSVAASLTFLAPDRTLTGAEVDAAVEKIVGALGQKLGGARR